MNHGTRKPKNKNGNTEERMIDVLIETTGLELDEMRTGEKFGNVVSDVIDGHGPKKIMEPSQFSGVFGKLPNIKFVLPHIENSTNSKEEEKNTKPATSCLITCSTTKAMCMHINIILHL